MSTGKAAVFFGPGRPFEIREFALPDVEPDAVDIDNCQVRRKRLRCSCLFDSRMMSSMCEQGDDESQRASQLRLRGL